MAAEAERSEESTNEVDANSESEDQAQDPVKQVKAEMNRKLSNVEAMQAETKKQLDAILAQVQASMQPKEEAAPKKPAKDLLFDDPDQFIAQVREQAVREATESVGRQYQASQAMQAAVQGIASQYPEFMQDGSEASRLAVQRANNLPKHLKGTAEGAELVMLKVAQELGLTPVGKRQRQVSEEEPVAGSRSTSAGSGANKGPKKRAIDEKTLALAELLGVDIKDPKRLDGLEKASTRKKWNTYQ